MRGKLTIYDIAKIAGVSPATVSRVIHRADYVREGTKQKVWKAFDDAGITPDMLAFKPDSAKKISETNSRVPVILACIPALNNPFYTDVLDGIIACTQDFGFKTIVCTEVPDNYHLEQFLEFCATLQIFGIILCVRLSEDVLYKLSAVYPLVQCSDYNPICKNIPYVNVDDYTVAREAVAWLARANCKNIGFFSAPRHFQFVQNRYRAYKTALKEAGLKETPENVIMVADFSYERILAAAKTFFQTKKPPDGIFAVSDAHAHAIIKASWEFGIKIPDDLKVIGFDNTMYAILSTPTITTISQPRRQLGMESARLLLEMIKNPSEHPESVTLPTQILWRETT